MRSVMPPNDVVTELDTAEPNSMAAHGALLYLMVRRETTCDLLPVPAGSEVTIGRSLESTVVVDDPRASRVNTRIVHERGEALAIDLGGRNGTRINEEVVRSETRRVFQGDVIRVGGVELVVAAMPATEALETDGPSAMDVDADVIATDPAMVRIFETVRKLAKVPTTVLILGETGAGKEVVAEQIHRRSSRADGPFVRLNCASLPEMLLESELFGYERGAFTGAGQRKQGFLETAHGGTLLLDEIGDLPLTMQAKLLRVLEDGRVTRLGGREEFEVDVRFVCATNRDLSADVAAGRFRQDLFFRISAFALKIPPLRERPLEIKLLTELFATRFAARSGLAGARVEPAALAALQAYSWPGNVRELRNAIEHAVVMAEGKNIGPEHLPESLLPARECARRSDTNGPRDSVPKGAAMRDQLGALERRSIEEALAAHGGNQSRAAQQLGISRRALLYKLTKYGIGR
jgi:DNA-binding NtrC family response regulator